MISCSYDYLSQDWNSISFVLYAYICNYCIPVLSCIYFYSQIVMAVVKHERALKEQAKKMNVENLRQDPDKKVRRPSLIVSRVWG